MAIISQTLNVVLIPAEVHGREWKETNSLKISTICCRTNAIKFYVCASWRTHGMVCLVDYVSLMWACVLFRRSCKFYWILTYWGRDTMAAISNPIVSISFPWLKIICISMHDSMPLVLKSPDNNTPSFVELICNFGTTRCNYLVLVGQMIANGLQ